MVLLLLLALTVAAPISMAQKEGGSSGSSCVVRLDISPATQLAFSGTSQASIIPSAFPVTVVEPPEGAAAPKIGLTGSMYLRTAAPGPCPSTAAEWLAAAGSLQLSTAPDAFLYKPLALFPPLLATEVMGLPLNISALQLNMSLAAKGRWVCCVRCVLCCCACVSVGLWVGLGRVRSVCERQQRACVGVVKGRGRVSDRQVGPKQRQVYVVCLGVCACGHRRVDAARQQQSAT